jgi:hypothetical protein
MLRVTADGTKFPPYIVLKRKTFPKICVKGITVQAQEAGWMEYSLDYIFNTLPSVHTPVGNSNIHTENVPSARLPIQGTGTLARRIHI